MLCFCHRPIACRSVWINLSLRCTSLAAMRTVAGVPNQMTYSWSSSPTTAIDYVCICNFGELRYMQNVAASLASAFGPDVVYYDSRLPAKAEPASAPLAMTPTAAACHPLKHGTRSASTQELSDACTPPRAARPFSQSTGLQRWSASPSDGGRRTGRCRAAMKTPVFFRQGLLECIISLYLPVQIRSEVSRPEWSSTGLSFVVF